MERTSLLSKEAARAKPGDHQKKHIRKLYLQSGVEGGVFHDSYDVWLGLQQCLEEDTTESATWDAMPASVRAPCTRPYASDRLFVMVLHTWLSSDVDYRPAARPFHVGSTSKTSLDQMATDVVR